MNLYFSKDMTKQNKEILLKRALEDYLTAKSTETGSVQSPLTTPVPMRQSAEGIGTTVERAYSYASASILPSVDSIVIGRSPKGKPYLCGFPDVHFSISHSGRFWVCLIGNKNIGVDIECLRDDTGAVSGEDRESFTNRQIQGRRLVKRQYLKIGRRFFAPDESKYLEESQSEEELEKRFLDIWTKKEAYVKYTGNGLGQGLRSFSVVSGVPGITFGNIDLEEMYAQTNDSAGKHRRAGGIITSYCFAGSGSLSPVNLRPLFFKELMESITFSSINSPGQIKGMPGG